MRCVYTYTHKYDTYTHNTYIIYIYIKYGVMLSIQKIDFANTVHSKALRPLLAAALEPLRATDAFPPAARQCHMESMEQRRDMDIRGLRSRKVSVFFAWRLGYLSVLFPSRRDVELYAYNKYVLHHISYTCYHGYLYIYYK